MLVSTSDYNPHYLILFVIIPALANRSCESCLLLSGILKLTCLNENCSFGFDTAGSWGSEQGLARVHPASGYAWILSLGRRVKRGALQVFLVSEAMQLLGWGQAYSLCVLISLFTLEILFEQRDRAVKKCGVMYHVPSRQCRHSSKSL